MYGYLFILGLLLVVSAPSNVQGYAKCIDVQPSALEVDEAWFKDAGRNGLHILRHSRCNNCENEEEWSWLKGRTTPKRMCWKILGYTSHSADGAFALDFLCEYTKSLSSQECKTVFKDTEFKGVNFGGSNTITLTDNKSYFAGVTCLLGKENFWWLASTTGHLDDATIAKVEAHFRDQGFKSVVATKAGGAKVVIETMKIESC